MASALLARLSGDYRRAAALYLGNGRLVQAARMFEKANEPIEAARLWLRGGDQARALAALSSVHPERSAELLSEEDYDDLAVRFFEQAGAFWKAAECARRLRRPLRAARLFERAGAFEQAARSYGDAGDEQQLLRVWERFSDELGRSGKFDDQQRIDLMRAKKLAEKEDLPASAELLERHGRWLAAARLWHRNGQLGRAVRAYSEGGSAVQAANLLEEAGTEVDSGLRGQVLEAVSRHAEAAVAYEESGNISGAMLQLEAAGAFGEAAKRAEGKGDDQRAVELWLAAGKSADAARVIAASGDLRVAAEVARRGGENKVAAELYRQLGDYLRAAQEHTKADQSDEAIKDLEMVSGSADQESANRLLVPLLVSSGRFTSALAALSAVGEQPGSLQVAYWRGRALEGMGRSVAAIDCYRTVVAEKPRYRDTAQRLLKMENEARDSKDSRVPREIKLRTLRSGERLQGRYEVEDEIGRGGWSIVYRARDVVRHRAVAIKLMTQRFALLEDAENRLREEVRLCRRLNHPNIVRVLEHGNSEGRLFVVMELAEGVTLQQRLADSGVLTEVQTAELTEQLAAGLEVAHRERVVHRDLTPANIVLQEESVKMMDFGIALSVDGGLSVDAEGNVLGTPHFMAPEQIQGLALDGRCDLYSLGAVLFTCLAGRPPFEGRTVTAVSLKHLQDPPPDLRLMRPDVNSSFIEIVEKLLAKSAAERFSSAREVIEALQTWRERTMASY